MIFEVTYFFNSPFNFCFKEISDSIKALLCKVTGVGWESKAKIITEEEIDCVAYCSLDKKTLKEAGKNFDMAPTYFVHY